MHRFASRTLFRAFATPRATLPAGGVAPLHTSRHRQSTAGYGNTTTSGQSTGTSSPKSPEDASAQSGGSRSKEAVETGSSPTAGEIPNTSEGQEKSNTSTSTSTSTSDADKFAMPDGLANGDARGRTGGGEPLSSSHPSAPAQPKISNASVPGNKPKLTEEQQAEVDAHNRDFENKHGMAERAADDKVNPKFWGGGGRRLEED